MHRGRCRSEPARAPARKGATARNWPGRYRAHDQRGSLVTLSLSRVSLAFSHPRPCVVTVWLSMSDDAQIPASKSYWPRRWPWLVTEALIVFVAAVTAYAPLRHDASGLALTLTVAATVAYACLTIAIMILNRRQVAALQEQVAIARGDAKRSQEALTQARTQATAELAVAQEASYRLTSARI